MSDIDWTAAACAGRTDLFFDYVRKKGRTEQARVLAVETEAKQICAACPILHDCRRHAITNAEPDGIWGGLTADERRPLMRAARPPGTRMMHRLVCVSCCAPFQSVRPEQQHCSMSCSARHTSPLAAS